MRKLIIALATAALMATGAVTSTAGIAQPSTAHVVTHATGQANKAIHRPTPGCAGCRI